MGESREIVWQRLKETSGHVIPWPFFPHESACLAIREKSKKYKTIGIKSVTLKSALWPQEFEC